MLFATKEGSDGNGSVTEALKADCDGERQYSYRGTMIWRVHWSSMRLCSS